MVKRQLDETEKRIANKNLKLLKEELEYIKDVKLRRKILSLDVAPLEYKKQLKDLEKEKDSLEREITEYESTIKVLTDQIRNGVEAVNENSKQKKVE